MGLVKRCCAIFILLALLWTLTGCLLLPDKTYRYTLQQDRSNIEKIEICTLEWKDRQRITKVLATLPEKDFDEFAERLGALECYRYGLGDHPRSYGDIVICIEYSNSEGEVIGLTNTGKITSTGEWQRSNYYFSYKEILKIASMYVDENLLKEVSNYI